MHVESIWRKLFQWILFLNFCTCRWTIWIQKCTSWIFDSFITSGISVATKNIGTYILNLFSGSGLQLNPELKVYLLQEDFRCISITSLKLDPYLVGLKSIASIIIVIIFLFLKCSSKWNILFHLWNFEPFLNSRLLSQNYLNIQSLNKL